MICARFRSAPLALRPLPLLLPGVSATRGAAEHKNKKHMGRGGEADRWHGIERTEQKVRRRAAAKPKVTSTLRC